MISNSILDQMSANKILSLKKDLIELQYWQNKLEENHQELDAINCIQKQIIQETEIANKIQRVRRENTISFASFCKYEQELLKELEYGHGNYDLTLAKKHEKKRAEFISVEKSFYELKLKFYKRLSNYSIR
ncbi:hypothetical protein [Mesonia mobilis]|uniref:Flagellar FliJ protein n=1 Tax=Mesonia mobilis TaxID=369791 RepID=A0ABQ3BW40_9FLAO|nr:hypothetical protein [Mesonia mobilis]MBQ0737003.1 hypothetical protein [Aquimarina celericrescens]GGZ56520.1 hypothetical protein GCM10008088_17620 [Mesonia mobilis]|tara:strand:+ start:279 stop:671 length:393 start_codon:yes stop_codon:yes gene_type:complete